ncbi:MAG: tyrosine-type recombinase/integrase [Pseudomonadota bacterium]
MTRVSLARIIADELATLRRFDPGLRPSGRPRRVEWSEKLPGFGVRYYSSGRSTYIVQSLMNGVTRTITLGNANVLSKNQALTVARRILLRAQVGEDPATKRKEVRKVPTYDDFLAVYWKQAAAKWKPNTLRTHDYYRGRHLDHAFFGMFIDEIEQTHVLTWFNKVSVNGGPGAGNRCFEILRSMFNHAERWGLRPEGSNPCTYIRPNKRRKCERFLSNQEITRLGEVLRGKLHTRPLHSTIVQLLLLTGCRLSEIKDLTWSEVKGGRLLLHDSKTGPRTVWLGDEAQMLLAALERRGGSDPVFWNKQTRRPVAEMHGFWAEVRAEANLPGVRLHDLRHSFASHAAARSETLPMIGKLLGHARLQTTSRYAHLDDGPVLEATQRIGDLIADAMGDLDSMNYNTMCDIRMPIHDR